MLQKERIKKKKNYPKGEIKKKRKKCRIRKKKLYIAPVFRALDFEIYFSGQAVSN